MSTESTAERLCFRVAPYLIHEVKMDQKPVHRRLRLGVERSKISASPRFYASHGIYCLNDIIYPMAKNRDPKHLDFIIDRWILLMRPWTVFISEKNGERLVYVNGYNVFNFLFHLLTTDDFDDGLKEVINEVYELYLRDKHTFYLDRNIQLVNDGNRYALRVRLI